MYMYVIHVCLYIDVYTSITLQEHIVEKSVSDEISIWKLYVYMYGGFYIDFYIICNLLYHKKQEITTDLHVGYNSAIARVGIYTMYNVLCR